MKITTDQRLALHKAVEEHSRKGEVLQFEPGIDWPVGSMLDDLASLEALEGAHEESTKRIAELEKALADQTMLTHRWADRAKWLAKEISR